jgi:hypothetical protein
MSARAFAQAAPRGQEFFDKGMNALVGTSVSRNDASSLDYLRQSANLGYAPAQVVLGSLYQTGRTVVREARQALDWYSAKGVICLRPQNSKTRKPETMPLEGELLDIIERCRAAAILQGKDGETRFAQYVFHHKSQSEASTRHGRWLAALLASGRWFA